MLSVEKLTRKYKNGSNYINAVDDITTHFNNGDFVFVLGASGSGKSTLLNVLCGLDTEIEGTVNIDGVDTSTFTKKEWAIYRNYYVGFVFQEYNLITHLKVWENVALPLLFQGVSKPEAKKRAIKELENVGLGKFWNKKPDQISGGQAQRVAIARALVTNPKVIMADEPTGALDSELGDKIISFLKKVSKDRIVIVVTHDEDLATKYASRIIRLSDGKVIDDSDVKPVQEMTKKDIEFDRPKMTLGMVFKFARNNVTSRMFRSIATAAVVSIGYISIFLLSFMIFGINNSLTETVGRFVPEDQYQLYSLENENISETMLQSINNMDEVADARYNIQEQLNFENRLGSEQSLNLTSVPYDNASLLEGADLFGRFPTNDHEIVIDVGAAAAIRGLNGVDEDSYQYIFDLINNTTLDLYYTDYSNFDTENSVSVGSYVIVGMIASQNLVYSATGYVPYDNAVAVSDMIHDEPTYQDTAIVYLNIKSDKDIDAFTISLRENQGLILENLYSSITSSIEDFMFTALKIFVAVASVSLIVSGILIGLVVYTSIIERVKEIGILTAIGAKQKNIVGIFIFESGMLGLMSSLIAILLSLLLTRIINGLFSGFVEQPLSILTSSTIDMTLLSPQLWIIAAVVGFSILYAMIAGLIPAFQASRLNAIKALRRE